MGSRKQKPKAGSKAASKPTSAPRRKRRTFATELAALLRDRGLAVPRGLASAPAQAYGSVDADRIDMFAEVSDEVLAAQAAKVAGWAARQRERAKREWDRSPLVAELKRRKLRAPAAPKRPVGASVPLRKPLGQWSDDELLTAARDWSERGRT